MCRTLSNVSPLRVSAITMRSPFGRISTRIARLAAAQRIEDRAIELDPALAGRDDPGGRRSSGKHRPGTAVVSS